MKYHKLMLLLTLVAAFSLPCWSVTKSDKIKPEWIKNPPQPLNNTYYFKVVEVDNGQNLNSSRILSQKDLINSIEREFNIKVSEGLESTSNINHQNANQDYSGKEVYTLKIESEDANVHIYYEKIDEYYESGAGIFKLYSLYAVSRSTRTANFDSFRLTNKHGANGVWRSAIVPGWGQLHKGNKTKGALILSSEIVCAAGIIITENLRASYIKKIGETHNIQLIKSYAQDADNMENIRNACIGAAVALYVYNIIDAAVAPGSKRVIVSPRSQRGLSIHPVAGPQMNGLALTYKF